MGFKEIWGQVFFHCRALPLNPSQFLACPQRLFDAVVTHAEIAVLP